MESGLLAMPPGLTVTWEGQEQHKQMGALGMDDLGFPPQYNLLPPGNDARLQKRLQNIPCADFMSDVPTGLLFLACQV